MDTFGVTLLGVILFWVILFWVILFFESYFFWVILFWVILFDSKVSIWLQKDIYFYAFKLIFNCILCFFWNQVRVCQIVYRLKGTDDVVFIKVTQRKFARHICFLYEMCRYELENKGIVFKARWFVRPDINTGATII